MGQDGNEVLQGHRDMLVDGLKRIFGEFDQQMLERVLPRFESVELAGGQMLFRQGEQDDSLYFVISGRLRALRDNEDGSVSVLGDIARGETVGELAFFTGEPRMATISALRDSVLARFSSEVFRELLTAYPLVSLNITRLVIERMQRAKTVKGRAKPVTLGIAAATPGVDTLDFAHRLAQALGAPDRTVLVTAKKVDEWLGQADAAQVPPRDVDASRRLVRKLEQVESENQFVLFIADAEPTEWTRRCLRHCDQILLLADTAQEPRIGDIEEVCLAGAGANDNRAAATLVLLHPPGTRVASGTARWLAPRPHTAHFHLRRDAAKDWARLGRVIGGSALGLVLSGGGARGFAHLGVMKALDEAGIEVDMAGGTSIGAVMASFAAMDLPIADAIAHARAAFRNNPTGDYNIVPMVSLIAGKRLRRVIDSGVDTIMGEGSAIEDLWKNYFCVTSNYTSARETVLTRGPLAKSMRASVSIPGALPPVMLDGELHIDGGTFNNFPTDVMAGMGASRIVGVNLLREGGRRYEMDELPGSWKLVFDKVRGKRHKLPGLVPLLLNTSIMYSYARQAESKRLVDLYFQPPVYGFGMLEWAQFDRIVQAGYEYARAQLETGGLPALAAPVTGTAGFGAVMEPLATAG
ncbi:MAG: patatin-like phospholipase family protein [Pseudomonadota bacterium]